MSQGPEVTTSRSTRTHLHATMTGAAPAPRRVLMLGDLHGDTVFATKLVRKTPRYDVDVIIQVGDFGYDTTSEKERYLDAVDRELDRADLHMAVVDGNHDNHNALNDLPIDPATNMRPLREHVTHLPRGFAWTWDDTVWAAAGGASSINSHQLISGFDWWPGEVMSMAEQHRVLNLGHVDVLVTHDAPWGTPTLSAAYKQHLPVWERLAPWPHEQVAASDRHQKLIRELCDALTVTRIIHGHHHHRYDDAIARDELPDLHVHGLGMNGQGQDAWMVVNSRGEPQQLHPPLSH